MSQRVVQDSAADSPVTKIGASSDGETVEALGKILRLWPRVPVALFLRLAANGAPCAFFLGLSRRSWNGTPQAHTCPR